MNTFGKDSPKRHLDQVAKQIAALDIRLEDLKFTVSTTSKQIEDLHTAITDHKVSYFNLSTVCETFESVYFRYSSELKLSAQGVRDEFDSQ